MSQRPLIIDDVLGLKSISDVQLSPDANRVAFVMSNGFKSHDEPAHSRIWLVELSNSHARCFTAGPRSDKEPRWSPDSRRLAFTSDRVDKGKHQLFLIDLDVGEAWRVVETPCKVTQPAWSPDGNKIAFVMTDADTDEEKRRKERHDDWQIADASPKFDRLYFTDVAAGTCQSVTHGAVSVWEFEWSPNGTQFVLLSAPRPGDDGWFDSELSIVDAGGGEPRRLLKTGKQFASPRWSPDGQQVAFISCTWSDPGLIGGDLYVVDSRSGTVWNLTANQPLSATWVQWKPNGTGLLFLAHSRGEISLNEIDVKPAGAMPRMIWSGAYTFSERSQPKFSTDREGRLIAVAREDPSRPRDIWTWSTQRDWKQVTQLQADFQSVKLGVTEQVTWRSRDQRAIQGLLIRPADSAAVAPFPTIVQVHGGPANTWPNRLFANWHDWGQLLAARGFAVLLPNFRGSFGWGTEFTEANHGDMGGADFHDIIAGVNHLVEQGIADPRRLGICGWSYGGFMTAWAITQTDRFRVAVMGASITNWISFHGTAEIPSWDTLFWREQPPRWDGPYAMFSPMAHVHKVKTPTLIVHGGADCCVPVTQSREFYRALVDRDVATELVIYPREGHAILEQSHQKDLLQRVLGWIERWMATGSRTT
jgi:dipeptidyl aminopeptidase/acylaminoacyl peptidase